MRFLKTKWNNIIEQKTLSKILTPRQENNTYFSTFHSEETEVFTPKSSTRKKNLLLESQHKLNKTNFLFPSIGTNTSRKYISPTERLEKHNKLFSISTKTSKEKNSISNLRSLYKQPMSKRLSFPEFTKKWLKPHEEQLNNENKLNSNNSKKKNVELVIMKAFNTEGVAFLRTKQFERDLLMFELLENPLENYNLEKYSNKKEENLIVGMKKELKIMNEVNNYLIPKLFTAKITKNKTSRKENRKVNRRVRKESIKNINLNSKEYIPVNKLYKIQRKEKTLDNFNVNKSV